MEVIEGDMEMDIIPFDFLGYCENFLQRDGKVHFFMRKSNLQLTLRL